MGSSKIQMSIKPSRCKRVLSHRMLKLLAKKCGLPYKSGCHNMGPMRRAFINVICKELTLDQMRWMLAGDVEAMEEYALYVLEKTQHTGAFDNVRVLY